MSPGKQRRSPDSLQRAARDHYLLSPLGWDTYLLPSLGFLINLRGNEIVLMVTSDSERVSFSVHISLRRYCNLFPLVSGFKLDWLHA